MNVEFFFPEDLFLGTYLYEYNFEVETAVSFSFASLSFKVIFSSMLPIKASLDNNGGRMMVLFPYNNRQDLRTAVSIKRCFSDVDPSLYFPLYFLHIFNVIVFFNLKHILINNNTWYVHTTGVVDRSLHICGFRALFKCRPFLNQVDIIVHSNRFCT